MNVLSLFDGISTGYQALKDLGIKVDNYFASEVDKYAIAIAKHNHPDIKHLGDVCGLIYEDGALFHHQNDNPMVNGGSYIAKIDLLIGGSPCQGFSFAGKQLNFNDPRSKLFFEFVRLLKETRPKYFMLENVRMKKEYQDVISEHLGVQPTMINSALLSAQNRVRLYWVGKRNDDGTYSKVEILQPEDRGLLLKDIIENSIKHDAKTYNEIVRVGNVNPSGRGMNGEVYSIAGKAPTLTTNKGEGVKITGGAMRGRYVDDSGDRLPVPDGSLAGLTTQVIEIRDDGKSNCLTSVQKDSLCIQAGEADLGTSFRERKAVYSIEGKCPTLLTPSGGYSEKKITQDNLTWRKVTPLECERLQTMADGYTTLGNFNGVVKPISNTQRYKALGNGWTLEVIKHIFMEMGL